jgi:hypothetical protein
MTTDRSTGVVAFLREAVPYFQQVRGEIVLGPLAGILMNAAVVLPAVFLGRAET